MWIVLKLRGCWRLLFLVCLSFFILAALVLDELDHKSGCKPCEKSRNLFLHTLLADVLFLISILYSMRNCSDF